MLINSCNHYTKIKSPFYHLKNDFHFLSKIFFMIKWTEGFFIFIWQCVKTSTQNAQIFKSTYFKKQLRTAASISSLFGQASNKTSLRPLRWTHLFHPLKILY